MTTKICACCGQAFEPRPQTPDQTFCSAPTCQRARKREWQRAKLQSDPDYRLNQHAAQQAWSERNQDYWRSHREIQPADEPCSCEQHGARNVSVRGATQEGNLVKMDACDLPTGLYRITRHPAPPLASSDSWVVEITPVCVTCPCKMDVSREDLIANAQHDV